MASEDENLDGAAANLQNAAKETLEKTETSSDGGSAGDSKTSGYIQNVAKIVLDKSNQAADSSKSYIANVVHSVEDYAQHAGSGAGGSNIQDTLSKALHVGANPGSTTGSSGEGNASSGTDGGLLSSIVGWCSSLCGSKNAAGEPRSLDLRAAADQMAQVLHSSTTTSRSVETPSTYSVTTAETLADTSATASEAHTDPKTTEE